jgi:hypothetical protein
LIACGSAWHCCSFRKKPAFEGLGKQAGLRVSTGWGREPNHPPDSALSMWVPQSLPPTLPQIHIHTPHIHSTPDHTFTHHTTHTYKQHTHAYALLHGTHIQIPPSHIPHAHTHTHTHTHTHNMVGPFHQRLGDTLLWCSPWDQALWRDKDGRNGQRNMGFLSGPQ